MLNLLRDTCTIQRFTQSSVDAHGQPTGTWANLAENVPFYLDESGGFQLANTQTRRPTGGSGVVVEEAVGCMLGTQDIKEADRIVHNSKTWDVAFVKPARRQAEIHHYELDLHLVREGD